MTSILRRPGNLARLSRTAAAQVYHTRHIPINAPRSKLSSFISSHRIRSYATVNPGGPKRDNDGGDKEPGKDNGNKNGDRKPPPEEKRESKVSEEEQKQIDTFIDHLKPTLPKSQQNMLEDMRAVLKSEGVPPELKNFIRDHIESGKPASLMEYVQLSRIMSRQVKGYAAKVAESDQTGDRDKDGEQQQQQKRRQRNDQQKKNARTLEFRLDPATVLITTVLTYYVYRSLFPGENSKEITWQEFRANFLDKGLVDRLTVLNENKVRVELHRDAVSRVYPDSPAAQPYFHYYFGIGSIDSFERRLDEAQEELGIPGSERIPVGYVEEVPWLATILSFGPTLLLMGSFFWLSRRAAGGAGGQSGIFGIGKSRARKFNQETDIKIKFTDVAGMDEAKVEIMEFVSFLKQPERFQRLGAKIPRGAILSGSPGTGKTLLAKATAGESAVPFFSVSGSEFVEMFVGVGPSRVRDLFANARKNTPCIVFIDEIDAIGKSRAKQGFGGGNDERESTLNQILTEMDGFNTSDQVVVLAGTNRPDVLDKALMRPGRFDRHITIDRPTMDGRKQIFGVYLKKIVTNEDMEYLTGRLAALTPGFAGADISNCVNEAALVGTFKCPTISFHSRVKCFNANLLL